MIFVALLNEVMKHVKGNEQRNELSRNSDDQNKHLKIKGIKM